MAYRNAAPHACMSFRQRPLKAAGTCGIADESDDPADLVGAATSCPSFASGALVKEFYWMFECHPRTHARLRSFLAWGKIRLAFYSMASSQLQILFAGKFVYQKGFGCVSLPNHIGLPEELQFGNALVSLMKDMLSS